MREKQQSLERDKTASAEHVELLRNKMAVQAIHKFFGFNPREVSERGGSEVSIVWLARVGVWVRIVVWCLTEQ